MVLIQLVGWSSSVMMPYYSWQKLYLHTICLLHAASQDQEEEEKFRSAGICTADPLGMEVADISKA